MKGALPFKFAQNKIALVEKENETDYIAMQYLIENDWNLVVTKSMDPELQKAPNPGNCSKNWVVDNFAILLEFEKTKIPS